MSTSNTKPETQTGKNARAHIDLTSCVRQRKTLAQMAVLSGEAAERVHEQMQVHKVLDELKISPADEWKLFDAIQHDLTITAEIVTEPPTWCNIMRERAIQAVKHKRAEEMAAIMGGRTRYALRPTRCCCCGKPRGFDPDKLEDVCGFDPDKLEDFRSFVKRKEKK